MLNRFKDLGGLAAFGAAMSFGTVPAAAAIPLTDRVTVPEDGAVAHQYRGRRYRRDRLDAGDVIAGAAILGGIAAIASAASRNRRERVVSVPPRYEYHDRRGDTRYDDSTGLGRAAGICANAIERDVRIETIDSVNRDASGWIVRGRLYDARPFVCRLDELGRVAGIDYAQGSYAQRRAAPPPAIPVPDVVPPRGGAERPRWMRPAPTPGADGELPDWAQPYDEEATPAYPGGPVPPVTDERYERWPRNLDRGD